MSATSSAILDSIPAGPVKLAVCDIDGVLRGKVISREKLQSALDDGFGFCNVVFGWDSSDAPYDNTTVSGWQTGYPDATVHVYPNTLRRIPWEGDTPFMLCDFEGGALGDVCPRTLLKQVLAKAEKMGFRVNAAIEYEWFNFAETPESLAAKHGAKPQPATPGMHGYSLLRPAGRQNYYRALWDGLTAFDVPLEGLHTETGPGVYEAAVHYSDALTAADRAVCLKLGTKQIALQHDLIAGFMAKWTDNLPGCGGHVHQSLASLENGTNLFANPHDQHGMSDLFQQYLAGQLYWLPKLMPMFAPNVNSYKRLVPGSWASTSASWGHDNRTTSLRVIKGTSPKGTRLEVRTPGADANPYLVLAASVAAGLYGIEHQLSLKQAPTTGNAYEETGLPKLPTNLLAATQAMRNAQPEVDQLLSPGFVDHFLRTRDWEWRQFEQAVTDWERSRYLEII